MPVAVQAMKPLVAALFRISVQAMRVFGGMFTYQCHLLGDSVAQSAELRCMEGNLFAQRAYSTIQFDYILLPR